MQYRYLFGPVPSRRLGQSLGVDLMPPKTCTLDCVYCECGKTTHLTMHVDTYAPVAAVKDELRNYLDASPDLDNITFSGFGEPTLHSGIGDIIAFLKDNYRDYAVAVLTNSTLLHEPAVRNRLSRADTVVASIDAVSEDIFKKINRPHPHIQASTIIEGVLAFRKEFNNKLLLEIFIVPGINDTTPELDEFNRIIDALKPDGIQVNALDRPGTEAWVMPLDVKRLSDIQKYLKSGPLGFNAVPRKHTRHVKANVLSAILSLLARRPCTLADISNAMNLSEENVAEYLNIFVQEKKVEKIALPRGNFFKLIN